MAPSIEWITDKSEIRERTRKEQRAGRKVGLVPTMGALHEGHASLIRRARAETDFVIVTIFVNPIQFVPGEDYARYPRTPERDQEVCARAGAAAIFAPTVDAMYPPESRTRVQVTGIEEPLCGGHRPGHFVGVATVVTKLFNLVPADIAYFGSKDYQQALLIERMAKDLDFPIKVQTCPTVREPDGLAMSSRNAYLTPEERARATTLFQSLRLAEGMVQNGERDPKSIRQKVFELLSSIPAATVDYVELLDAQDLAVVARIDRPTLLAIAVRLGKARLIDNTVLVPPA